MVRMLSLSAALVLSASVCAQDDPMTVTTDTKDYCISLAGRISSADSDMAPHVRVLWEEGRAMCEHGHVRSGLFRLRRAMQMIHGSAE